MSCAYSTYPLTSSCPALFQHLSSSTLYTSNALNKYLPILIPISLTETTSMTIFSNHEPLFMPRIKHRQNQNYHHRSPRPKSEDPTKPPRRRPHPSSLSPKGTTNPYVSFLFCPPPLQAKTEKKDQKAKLGSASTNRPIWLFRGREDAHGVNLNRWSTVDTRFRGVYKTLKKVPAQFAGGIYEDGSHEQLSSSSSSSRINFTNAAKAQGQIVYALLHEILDMMRIGRRKGGASFVLRCVSPWSPQLFLS